MTTLKRIVATAEMLGRDLLRRRLALVLLVILPAAFYVSTRWGEGGNGYTSGGIGLSWSIAGAALYSALAARPVDRRLVLDGYRPVELLAGRVLLLTTFGLTLASAFTVMMWAFVPPQNAVALIVAMLLVALVAVPLGLAIAGLVPHELEGTLVLIGLVGIEMSLPSTGTLEGVLPFGAPHRLLNEAAGRNLAFTPCLARGLAWAALLLVIAIVAWWGRVHVIRHDRTRVRPHPAGRYSLLAAGALALAVIAYPWSIGDRATHGHTVQSSSTLGSSGTD
ncbi:MAG: hypothetical protein JOZ99_08115 [Actinobacteria bacterium]|nr:hypothetical protein [Actinomycetota bacterium]